MKAGVFELSEAELRTQMIWLRRLAGSLVGGPQAEDAVQDTLVAALEHPPATDRDVRPWLARVLANFVRRGHRSDRRRRNREIHAGDKLEGTPPAEDLLVRHEAARVVAGLVSALSDPHRALMLLRFAEGRPAAEIARLRGVPEGTVRRQIKEALDGLRAAVAAHYGREQRDWRLALLPLAAQRPEPAVPKTEVVMVNEIKVLIGLAAAVLAVGVVLLGRGPRSGAEPAGPGAHARAGESSGTTALAGPAGPGRGGPLFTTAAPGGSGPPAFTTALAADPPGCRDKLAELRTQASEVIPASPALFERARPSPRKQAEIAPIIERVIGRPASKAGYQIECRTSLCRITVVREPGSAEVQAWFQGLGEDAELGAIRGGRPSARYSERTRDALTGSPLVKLTFFMGIPQAGDEEHPSEADGGTTCGQRVAALEKAMDDLRKRRMQRRGQSGNAPAGRAAGQPGAHRSPGGCLSPRLRSVAQGLSILRTR